MDLEIKSEVDIEIEDITSNLETYIKVVSNECGFCGDVFESDEESVNFEIAKQEVAEEMHKEGWRKVSSEKFQMISLACPECVELPDEERGE